MGSGRDGGGNWSARGLDGSALARASFLPGACHGQGKRRMTDDAGRRSGYTWDGAVNVLLVDYDGLALL